METSEGYLHAKIDKTMTIGTEVAHLKDKILFIPPYDWIDIDWDLVNRLTEDVAKWGEPWIPVNNQSLSFDACLFASHCNPLAWLRAAPKDEEAYAKIVLSTKMMVWVFEVDDMDETISGTDLHPKLGTYTGTMMAKIIQLELESIEDIRNFELYPTINKISKRTAHALEVLLPLAQELKNVYGMTRKTAKHFAHLYGKLFRMHTWCGDKDQTYLLNPYTQYNCRWFTGGICSFIELAFLLDRIYIPRAVRYNDYWCRMFHVAGFLTIRMNDLSGVEKEYMQERSLGKRSDNVVFHYMDSTNCTLEQAFTRAVIEHNFALKEFNDIVKYSKDNPDALYGLTEEEKIIFARTVEITADSVRFCMQTQCNMARYNPGFKVEFVTCKSVYGLQTNVNANENGASNSNQICAK